MVSMRDPLRDTLEFHKFAIGVFLGSLLLALPAFQLFDYRRLSPGATRHCSPRSGCSRC